MLQIVFGQVSDSNLIYSINLWNFLNYFLMETEFKLSFIKNV